MVAWPVRTPHDVGSRDRDTLDPIGDTNEPIMIRLLLIRCQPSDTRDASQKACHCRFILHRANAATSATEGTSQWYKFLR